MLTFQNLKMEMLEYVWEQFPHIQKIRCGEKSEILFFYIFSYKLPINRAVACMLQGGVAEAPTILLAKAILHVEIDLRSILPAEVLSIRIKPFSCNYVNYCAKCEWFN